MNWLQTSETILFVSGYHYIRRRKWQVFPGNLLVLSHHIAIETIIFTHSNLKLKLSSRRFIVWLYFFTFEPDAQSVITFPQKLLLPDTFFYISRKLKRKPIFVLHLIFSIPNLRSKLKTTTHHHFPQRNLSWTWTKFILRLIETETCPHKEILISTSPEHRAMYLEILMSLSEMILKGIKVLLVQKKRRFFKKIKYF